MAGLKKWLPVMLITIGLLGIFHVTMGWHVGCTYDDGKSVLIWPWDQCYVVKTYLVTATGGDPDFIPDILPPGWHWISGFEADTYATVRIPIMPPLSPRQSEILILLGIALLALRKLPDRAGAVA